MTYGGINMCEEHYVFLSQDDDLKIIKVEKKVFVAESEEAITARAEEEKIFNNARKGHYKVLCNEKVIYSDELVKQREAQEKAKRQVRNLEYMKEQLEREQKLAEIKQKDLLELSEEEIVLLAKLNIKPDYRDKYCMIKGTNFEIEYRNLMQKIEQKRNEKSNTPKI